MKKLAFILFVCLSISNFNCTPSEELGYVNARFKLLYKGLPLEMFKEYQYPGGNKIIFNRFSFFLADVNLQNQEGQLININPISYIDLTNSHTGSTAKDGLLTQLSKNGVKPGSYKKIILSLGVPKEYNDKKPSDFNSKPLSDQAEYWSAWKSYIFTRTEGQIDLNNDGKFEESYSLHTGGNEAFRTIEFPIDLAIGVDEEKEIVINIDLYKQFDSGSKVYDIKKYPQTHSKDNINEVKELIDNLAKAISIK